MPAGSSSGARAGRKQAGGTKRSAPGSEGGLGGAGAPPVPGPGAPPGTSPAFPARATETSRPASEQQVALDKMAPVPEAPPRYPPGTRLYQLPITFTIELLDPARAAAKSGAAAAEADGEGS
jgi:hypothetical protein